MFQNPFETFNPLRRLEDYLHDTAVNFGRASNRRSAAAVTDEALRLVGLSLEEAEHALPSRAVGRPDSESLRSARSHLEGSTDRRRRAGFDGRCLAADVDRQPVPQAA